MTQYFDRHENELKFRCWVTLHPHTKDQEVKAVVSYVDHPGVEILLDKEELLIKR